MELCHVKIFGLECLKCHESSYHDCIAVSSSLKLLFDNGADINKIFDVGCAKNETLFNMIGQIHNMTDTEQLKMLIEYKFDFKKLINIFDSNKNETGSLVLCKYNHSYSNVKLLIQHVQI